MAEIKKGDMVSIHYKGTLDDGQVFDSSEGRDPLDFEVGSGQVIEGFDEAVMGMVVGDKKSFHLPPEKAYGDRRDDMVVEFPKAKLPDDVPVETGTQLMMDNGQGGKFPVVIVEAKEDVLILDANHPLAGKALNFEIEVVKLG